MSSIVVAGDTSGSITLAAPSVAGSTTLTLPATSGTIITTGTNSRVIPAAAVPSGSIIQVVSNSLTTTTSVNANGGTATISGLNATITPQFSTSKILVQLSIMYGTQSGNSTTYGGYFTRNGTKIGAGTSSNGSAQQVGFTLSSSTTGDANQTGYVSYQYLDSPSSTSALTYQVVVCNDNNFILYVNYSANNSSGITGKLGISTVTLMEIAV